MTMQPPRPHASSPRPNVAPARTRVRWDNVMILLVGLVAAAFAVTLILANGTRGDAQDSRSTPRPATPETTPAVDAAALADGIDMDDARGLVDEATALLRDARWDEATDRLTTVPEELREISGAAALLTTLEESKARYTTLRSQLDAAVEARQWKTAKSLLAELATIATPTDELTAIQTQVTTALAADDTTSSNTASDATKPSATAKPKPAKQPATTSGGGASSSTSTGSRPSGTTSSSGRPQSQGSRPTSTGTGAGTSTGSGGTSTGTSTGTGAASGDIITGISAAQQQELENALESALAGSELALQ